ncbi:fumarylacetoacetate hydrolase family protein [Streptomyces griseocarneus]|uniref:fumarylacetoacetate hydrolase family protein n=1 Tax=Streptomyces griseocarneus TaxID=51201 RepID=UPI00167CE5FA|nr:fumarylacetoacetate hydrolase family protein [Streptomyces griseocarneus]MBZ6477332.1 fumarylacetoacetate hydrolase family protein [Streptomyces griseocarneus]GHG76114.1 fumarylacetoacetase [Streptomyces griseocarneus]
MPQHHPRDLAEGDPFGPDTLPYGVFTTPDAPARPRVGVRYGAHVLDAAAAAAAHGSAYADLLAAPTLNPLMAAGRPVWEAVRAEVRGWLDEPYFHPLEEVTLHLPFEVADYVDFYASEHHAANVGRIFRPGGEALTPNWKHLPIGYHGRAGTVVVTGTDVVRPQGQRKAPGDELPTFGPSLRLDIEAEVGFVVGTPAPASTPVPLSDFREHVFGVCLVNDWSSRDLQAWEYVPLGPFLGKSFATSVSAWITPLDAFDAARTAPPARTYPLLPYLDDSAGEPGGIDLRIEVRINGEVVSRPPFSAMYWTAAQQLAHMTVNGASLRTGDFYASGTVSGPEPDQLGCLLELTGGKGPFLADGDEVTLTAWAPGANGARIGLGEVTGRIVPARTAPPGS